MSFRDIKLAARRNLHQHMKVPALYIDGEEDPVEVHVRIHTQWAALGEVSGTSFDYAEKEDIIPRIIFDRSEVDNPARNSIVMVSAEEGYRVDSTLPIDLEWRTAKVSRLMAAELVGKPVPTHE